MPKKYKPIRNKRRRFRKSKVKSMDWISYRAELLEIQAPFLRYGKQSQLFRKPNNERANITDGTIDGKPLAESEATIAKYDARNFLVRFFWRVGSSLAFNSIQTKRRLVCLYYAQEAFDKIERIYTEKNSPTPQALSGLLIRLQSSASRLGLFFGLRRSFKKLFKWVKKTKCTDLPASDNDNARARASGDNQEVDAEKKIRLGIDNYKIGKDNVSFFSKLKTSVSPKKKSKRQYGAIKVELINFQLLDQDENLEYLGRIDDKQGIGNTINTLCYLFRNKKNGEILSLFTPAQDIHEDFVAMPSLTILLKKRQQAKQPQAEEKFSFIVNPVFIQSVDLKHLYTESKQEIIPLGLKGKIRRHWVTLQILPEQRVVNYIDPQRKSLWMRGVSVPISCIDSKGNYSYLTTMIKRVLKKSGMPNFKFNKIYLGNQTKSDAYSCGAHQTRITLALAKNYNLQRERRYLSESYFDNDKALEQSAYGNKLLTQEIIRLEREKSASQQSSSVMSSMNL